MDDWWWIFIILAAGAAGGGVHQRKRKPLSGVLWVVTLACLAVAAYCAFGR